MKRLVIIRHGKSSWKHQNLKDHQRPLKQRGVNNAFSVAKELMGRGVKASLFLSSPAVRALDTAIIIATNMTYPLDSIAMENTIYEASVQELLSVLSEVDDGHETVFIFGHNPSFTGLVNRLQEESIFNLPTCGAMGIELPISSWKEISQTKGDRMFLLIPKELK